MGRYNFRTQRVLAAANLAIENNLLRQTPLWHSVLAEIPPPPRLTRPILQGQAGRGGRTRRKFSPPVIRYEEDSLRQEFFSDHPWELARPRVILENSGDDYKSHDWSSIDQVGKSVDGESVVQRQLYLMKQERHSRSAAYDLARREFYARRHYQDIERRIAQEEALSTGAYFMPSVNAIAEKLEDAKWEKWKRWAAKGVQEERNRRQSGYSGADVEESSAELVDENLEAGQIGDQTPTEPTTQQILGEVVQAMR